jgi:general stress protein CsbA
MSRVVRRLAVAVVAFLAIPSAAFAEITVSVGGASPFRLIISAAGLAVTIILLLEVIMLRKVALGGAITERIRYVVLAIICLGASALAQWTSNFVHGITLEQMELAAEMLVIVAMALFTAYFSHVRKAFEGFLSSMTGGEQLAAELEAESKEPDPGA